MASTQVDKAKEHAAETSEFEAQERGGFNIEWPQVYATRAHRVSRRSSWGLGLKVRQVFSQPGPSLLMVYAGAPEQNGPPYGSGVAWFIQ